MKLEIKFHKYIFYPLLFSVVISLILVLLTLFLLTNKNIDRISQNDVISVAQSYINLKIYIAKTLLFKFTHNTFLIIEQFYSSYLFINNCSFKDTISNKNIINALDPNINKKENSHELGYWFINDSIKNIDNLSNDNLKHVISNLSHSLFSLKTSFLANINDSTMIFSYYENSGLFFSFPLKRSLMPGGLINKNAFNEYNNPEWCDGKYVSGNSKFIDFKCCNWYVNLNDISKSSSDKNSLFILPLSKSIDGLFTVITVCLRFNDTILNETAYICIEVTPDKLFTDFDKINSELKGHFIISIVNSELSFYYPYILQENLNDLLPRYEYSEDNDYYLEEYLYFKKNVFNTLIQSLKEQLNMNDNYPLSHFISYNPKYYNSSLYKNQQLFNFSIYPFLILHNGNFSHLLSIIYIYRNQLYFESYFSYLNRFNLKLYLGLVLFILFSLYLLIIVHYSLKSLAKYIVIPIKNVQYMLKGINIGGENRLNFLDELKKRELNEEKYFTELNIISQKGLSSTKTLEKNTLSQTLKYDLRNITLMEEEDTNLKVNVNRGGVEKYKSSYGIDESYESLNRIKSQSDDNETNFENEIHFYDYNEELLQYRPKEINGLVNTLLDLKGVLILTSSTNNNNKGKEKIINYSLSEKIFESMKNTDGTYICRSNIGNTTATCFLYDKAIYHLCSSLDIQNLNNFLSNIIKDQFDTNNYLLDLLESQYSIDKDRGKPVALELEKIIQKKTNQKFIVNLINNRYNKLIFVYFRFFGLLKKSKRRYDDVSGLFLHTEYHTITYFHKKLIEYVYLCYISNDTIKLGESILNYIEFLIKFKLSTENHSILNKHSSFHQKKQEIKKKTFNKVEKWIDLFEEFLKHVNENTSLGNGPQFKVLCQGFYFLQGKFALKCKCYSEAVFYFVSACKKDLLVYDASVKRKALLHLRKLIPKLQSKLQKVIKYEKEYSENRNSNNDEDSMTESEKYYESICSIKSEIEHLLEFSREKKSKDVLIVIDKGSFSEKEYDMNINEINKIFNYIKPNERFALIIFDSKYRIICPITRKDQIDYNQFYSSLTSYKIEENIKMPKEQLISNLNFCMNYLLIKQIKNSKKFIIFFTKRFHKGENWNLLLKIKKEKNINLIINGEMSESFISNNRNILQNFGDKSELINLGETHKIKDILADTFTVNEEVPFLNEIYESKKIN